MVWAGALGSVAGCVAAQESDAGLPSEVGLEAVVTGLEQPTAVAFASDADLRYVADRPGRIYAHGPDGVLDEPFLDLRDAVQTGGERGLLGVALHPEFADTRRAFVRYSAPRREGTPAEYSHTFVVAEFEATADGRRAKRDSERTVMEIPEPREMHNAGDLAFGPDGYLYVAVGDSAANPEGGGWGGPGSGRNGQDVTENLLGSILRVDPDGQETVHGEQRNYAIPDDNPLVDAEGLDEHYAWGFRNPWRVSWDGEDFYVADVGKDHYEEVNLVEKGGNYGWNVREGTHCFKADECPERTPDDVRGGEPLLDPIVEYSQSDGALSGASVIGGHVYRGSALPALRGAYVFGDLRAQGRLFAATRPGDGGDDDGGNGGGGGGGDSLWSTTAIQVAGGEGALRYLLAFGRDADGEVYALGAGSDGTGLYRVVPAE